MITDSNSRAIRVVIVGSGNVAEAFALALNGNKHVVLQQIFARNEERGRRVAELAHSEWSNTSLAEAEARAQDIFNNLAQAELPQVNSLENLFELN